MIDIKGKYLTWRYFPDNISSTYSKVFLFAKDKVNLQFMHRENLRILTIDLNENTKDLFQSFNTNKRRKIRKAKSDPVRIVFSHDKQLVTTLFYNIAKEIGLKGLSADQFPESDQYIITSAMDFQGRLLASQAYLYDHTCGKALLYINASDFRNAIDQVEEKMIARSNDRLAYESMLWLRENGLEELILQLGADDDDDTAGVDYWKRGFNGQISETFNYYPLYYWIYRKIRGWS